MRTICLEEKRIEEWRALLRKQEKSIDISKLLELKSKIKE